MLISEKIKQEKREKAESTVPWNQAINNCDWVIDGAKELKALLSYNSKEMLNLNKTRVLSGIDTMIDALKELRLFASDNQ